MPLRSVGRSRTGGVDGWESNMVGKQGDGGELGVVRERKERRE